MNCLAVLALAACQPNVSDKLLVIEPVTFEVLGDVERRNGRDVFVDCDGREYELREDYEIRPTQDLC